MMIENRMTPRLYAIAKLVGEASVLADIGTDHGILPAYLLENKRIEKAIVADISKPSLDKAIMLMNSEGYTDSFSARCGNGLSVLNPDEADKIVIAGMGGVLITELLSNSFEVAKNAVLTLQPMTGADRLREYLYSHGFEITDELHCNEDKRFYVAMNVRYIGENLSYTTEDVLLGRNYLNALAYKDYLAHEIDSLRQIYNAIPDGNARKDEVAHMLKLFEVRCDEITRTL